MPSPNRRSRAVRSIDHMGLVYLWAAMADIVGFFPPGTSADRIVDTIRPQLASLPRALSRIASAPCSDPDFAGIPASQVANFAGSGIAQYALGGMPCLA